MHKTKTKLRSAAMLIAALLFAASVPAFAEGSTSGTSGTGTGTGDHVTTTPNQHVETPKPPTPPKPHTEPSTEPTVKPLTGDVKTTAETDAESQGPTGDSGPRELHTKGAALVAEAEKGHKSTKTDAEKKNICEDHKKGMTAKFSAIVTNSQRIQDKIDGIFAKAQTYQQTNNLNPANYDSLLTAAKSAQTTSNASIAALKDVTPTSVDCTSGTVATDVATFKAAAQQTRDNLKSYRTAVKAVLQALELGKTDKSADSTKPATTGGTN